MLELLLSRLEKLQPLRICNASSTNEAEQVDILKIVIFSKLFYPL